MYLDFLEFHLVRFDLEDLAYLAYLENQKILYNLENPEILEILVIQQNLEIQ